MFICPSKRSALAIIQEVWEILWSPNWPESIRILQSGKHYCVTS